MPAEPQFITRLRRWKLVDAAITRLETYTSLTEHYPWIKTAVRGAVAIILGLWTAVGESWWPMGILVALGSFVALSYWPTQPSTKVGGKRHFSIAAEDENEPFVEFTLPGSWAEEGFRYRYLGADGQHALHAEQVYLRIVAKQTLHNASVEIAARQNVPRALEPNAKIVSGEFLGTVTKERDQDFQIMQRTYWDVPVTYTDPNTGHQPVGSLRVEKDVFFFPENPTGRFAGQMGHTYYFQVKVHHDHGPDVAEFAIELCARREGPQSIFRALKNIRPVSK